MAGRNACQLGAFGPVTPKAVEGCMSADGVTVLGIDPGSRVTGWGIVREVSGVLSLVDCGAVRPKGDDFAERLGTIYHDLHTILCRHAPDEAAVENVFTAKNAASALKLGQARGAAIAACSACHLPVFSYAPTEIKKTLVGVGRAEKEQVSFMVARLLGVKGGWGADTGDALAAAVCHLNMRRFRRLVSQR